MTPHNSIVIVTGSVLLVNCYNCKYILQVWFVIYWFCNKWQPFGFEFWMKEKVFHSGNNTQHKTIQLRPNKQSRFHLNQMKPSLVMSTSSFSKLVEKVMSVAEGLNDEREYDKLYKEAIREKELDKINMKMN